MQVVAEKGRHREQVHSKRMAIVNQLRFEMVEDKHTTKSRVFHVSDSVQIYQR